jgi:small nuclear ribonucleoprotein (snRNP)-like protein
MDSQQQRIPRKQRPAAPRVPAAPRAPAAPRVPDHVPVPPAPPDLIYSRRRGGRAHQAPSDAKRKRAARKRLPRMHRSLAVLLAAVRDEHLNFEMKDGTSVAGALFEVDANMNATLRDATQTLRNGSTRRYESAYVNGSAVLYVLFPDSCDAVRSLDRFLDAQARVDRTQTRAKRTATARAPTPDAISIAAPARQRDLAARPRI